MSAERPGRHRPAPPPVLSGWTRVAPAAHPDTGPASDAEGHGRRSPDSRHAVHRGWEQQPRLRAYISVCVSEKL